MPLRGRSPGQLHFVSEPEVAAREMARVVLPGGSVAACEWDFDDGMGMLRAYWDAALGFDREAPDEARLLRFGRPGEIAELFASAQLAHIEESTLSVVTQLVDDQLLGSLLRGAAPPPRRRASGLHTGYWYVRLCQGATVAGHAELAPT